MLRTFLAAFAVAAVLTVPAQAQRPRAPAGEKPYQAVAVTHPAALADAGFEVFRTELAAVAKGRVYAELARSIGPHGFFWDRDFANRFNRKRPAVDNLAAALRLEHRGGAGWDKLARFATEPTAEPMPARPGIVCAPAKPDYDMIALDRLLDATGTKDADWRYPRADATPVRAAASPDAAAVETTGLHFVRVLGDASPDKSAGAVDAPWLRVATPAGNIGFVTRDALVALATERLCYGKDAVGRWHIAGFVSAGD